MKEFIETLYKTNLYPLNNDIKDNIYTQFYKHLNKFPVNLKRDIETFAMINYVMNTYKSKLYNRDNDDTYLCYLYNDLVHTHYNTNDESKNTDRFVYNDMTNRFIMQTFESRTTCVFTPFIVERIKYFWKLLKPNQRLNFIMNRCV